MMNFEKLAVYVNYLAIKAKAENKNDGKHHISKACGAIEIDDIQYEVVVSLEPRPDKWLGYKEMPDFVDVSQKE